MMKIESKINTTTQLTFTRFIAALMIVIFHFGRDIFKIENEFITTLRGNFNLGVSYFFVLSGFVMIIAYGDLKKVDSKSYWINRISRIYPLHIFTLLLSLLVYVLISINYIGDIKINIPSLIANATLVQAWFPQYSLSYNVPSWSISVEMFFYLCFPFIFNQGIKKLKFKTISIIIILFWIISQLIMNLYFSSIYYDGNHSLDSYALYYMPISHLNSFLVGILFGYYCKQYKYKYINNYDILVIIIFIITCVGIYFSRELLVHNGLHALGFGLLILFLTFNNGYITEIFNNKKLIYLGEISFAMYLLQNPIYIFFEKVFDVIKINNPYLIFFIPFIILILCSHLTFKYIELPMKNILKKKLGYNK